MQIPLPEIARPRTGLIRRRLPWATPSKNKSVWVAEMRGPGAKTLARLSRLRRPGGGQGIDQFVAPHGLCVDSRGDIYVGEMSWTQWPRRFPKHPCRTIRDRCKNSEEFIAAFGHPVQSKYEPWAAESTARNLSCRIASYFLR